MQKQKKIFYYRQLNEFDFYRAKPDFNEKYETEKNQDEKREFILELNEKRLELTEEQAEKVKFKICGHSSCSLSRKLQCKMGDMTDDIVVLQIQQHKKYVQAKKLKNLIENGIKIGSIEYQFYTSTSSGQKERKLVFVNNVKKDLIGELDCGLDDGLINQKGGIIISKLLAYRGLNLTGSEKWFDYQSDLLNHIIVVPDFENRVIGEVDSVNEVTYEITRLIRPIKLNQTDGCGICLPEVSDKALQIRAPWIKGVVAPFDFVRFIQEFGGNPIVTDIFGQQHNVLDEEIKIILTESMLKMSGYYNSFYEYKNAFIKAKCEFAIAKQEPKNYSKKVELSYRIAIFKNTIRGKSGCTDEQIFNVLIKYCYENNRLKRTSFLWDCYDEIILKNLKNNLSNRTNCCQICGGYYEPKSNHQSVTCGCKSCRVEYDKISKRVEYHKHKIA